jgi:hypothetical protein
MPKDFKVNTRLRSWTVVSMFTSKAIVWASLTNNCMIAQDDPLAKSRMRGTHASKSVLNANFWLGIRQSAQPEMHLGTTG